MEIRCLIKNEGHLYVAMSLDFGLAAQADSVEAARNKLIQQIEEYLREANEEDAEFKDRLLSRKGPWSWFVLYYLIYLMSKLHIELEKFFAFVEVTPNYMHHHI